MFEQFKTLITLIKDLAWPIIAGALIFYFAKPLQDLLNSMSQAAHQGNLKLTTSGIEILSNQSEPMSIEEFIRHPKSYRDIFLQNKAEKLHDPLVSKKQQADRLLQQHEANLVDDINKEIKEFLKTVSPHPHKQIELLQNFLCDAYITIYFERTFQRILGSQIQLLETLEKTKDFKLTQKEVYEFFKKVLPENAQMQASYDKWLRFLENSKLIKEIKEDIQLNAEGQEFLKYIRSRRYQLAKAG